MRHLPVTIALLAGIAVATPASAQSSSTLSGAAIGAGSGAIVAGPIGAVAGGVIGAVVGGPTFHRSGRYCWHDSRGFRHCRWR
jgi:osmotically inducible lipoprotein OsmB